VWQRVVKVDNILKKSGMQIKGRISPKWAPIQSLIIIWCMEKPVKPSFSVPVETGTI
jgi:hypothetical protein